MYYIFYLTCVFIFELVTNDYNYMFYDMYKAVLLGRHIVLTKFHSIFLGVKLS